MKFKGGLLVQLSIFELKTASPPKGRLAESLPIIQILEESRGVKHTGQNIYTMFTPDVKKPLQIFCKGLIIIVGVTRLELATP